MINQPKISNKRHVDEKPNLSASRFDHGVIGVEDNGIQKHGVLPQND